jgi:hypothetical protein
MNLTASSNTSSRRLGLIGKAMWIPSDLQSLMCYVWWLWVATQIWHNTGTSNRPVARQGNFSLLFRWVTMETEIWTLTVSL